MSAHNAGDMGSIPGWGRSPGEGNGNRLQYSCLENPMDGGAWWSLRVGQDSATSLSLFTFMHWRRKWQPTPVFLPEKSHRQRSLAGYNPKVCKELDMTEQLSQRRQWHPTPVLLPGKSHGWRSLVGCSPWGR